MKGGANINQPAKMNARAFKTAIAAIEKKAANHPNADFAAGLCKASEMMLAASHEADLDAIKQKTARRIRAIKAKA